MIFPKHNYSSIAKERLQDMIEADSLEYSSKDIAELKKEIASLVSRYFNQPAELYEIRIIRKQNKKRVSHVETL